MRARAALGGGRRLSWDIYATARNISLFMKSISLYVPWNGQSEFNAQKLFILIFLRFIVQFNLRIGCRNISY